MFSAITIDFSHTFVTSSSLTLRPLQRVKENYKMAHGKIGYDL